MILLESPGIRLDYNPTTDILTADIAVASEFYKLEIRRVLDIIVETVRHYDVKRLLMDSRKRRVGVEEKEYLALMTEFAENLQGTRLQKLARLHSGVTERENIATLISAQFASSFALETFQSPEEAIVWLSS